GIHVHQGIPHRRHAAIPPFPPVPAHFRDNLFTSTFDISAQIPALAMGLSVQARRRNGENGQRTGTKKVRARRRADQSSGGPDGPEAAPVRHHSTRSRLPLSSIRNESLSSPASPS